MTGIYGASPSTKPKRPEWVRNLVVPVLVTVIGGLLVAITTPAGAAVREVFFPTRVAVSGVVESGGVPVRDARVQVGADGPNASTDEAGRFQLTDVGNGKHDLRIEAAGIRSHVHKFSLASGAPATDLGIIKVAPYLRLGYYASVKPPTQPAGDPKVKYDVTLWLFGGDDAMRTVLAVAYTRPAPLPRDQVRGAGLDQSFCYRVRGSVRFSDLMVLGGAFASAQATVRLTDNRSFGVAAVPGAEQPPDCRAAKGPDADELPEPVPDPFPNPDPNPDPNPNPHPNPEPKPEPVAVPEVAGMSQADAEQELRKAGFEPRTRRQRDDSVPDGQAIGTDPPAGAKRIKGTEVVLRVSTGPSEGCDSGTVPNVIGLNEDAARTRLECSGFTVAVVPGDGDGAEGTVVGQSPKGGTSAEPGAKVSIKVIVRK